MMRGAGGGTFSARAAAPVWSGATEESGAAVCLRSMIFFLSLTACFSILSMQRVSAWYMSAFVSFAVRVCSRPHRLMLDRVRPKLFNARQGRDEGGSVRDE